MSIKAVIFDLDGLMLDTEPAYRRAWTEAAESLGFVIDPSFYNMTIGIPNSEGAQILAQYFGAQFPLQQFNALWKKLFGEYVEAGQVEKKHGLDELVAAINSRGYKKAIATSSTQAEIDCNPLAVELAKDVAAVTTCDELANTKPHPEIFLKTAKKLSVNPSETLALEDSNNGMRSAIAAGCISVMVPDMVAPAEDVQKGAHTIVTSLLDVIPLIEKRS